MHAERTLVATDRRRISELCPDEGYSESQIDKITITRFDRVNERYSDVTTGREVGGGCLAWHEDKFFGGI